MEYVQTTPERLCKSFKADCVIRSISIATQQSYRDVFAALMQRGLDMGAYPSHDKVWIGYLVKVLGWTQNKPPRRDGKLIKLESWDCPQIAVVRNSRHLTAIFDGALHDEWDCRYRPVNTYWTPGP